MGFIGYERKGKIVTITLNRPDRLNALSQALLLELGDAWERYAADDEARAAILTGRGRAFSAGLDIYELPNPGSGETKGPRLGVDEITGIMPQLEKPIIAAINGLALAGGCILVLRSDIRIAAETAILGMPEVNLGLYGGVDMLIAQRIPLCVVMELALTGKPISAQRAYEVGLVNRVVPDAEVMPAAMEIAEAISELSPLAVRLNKRVAIEAIKHSPEVLMLRKTIFENLLQSEDFQEAKLAFKEKRKGVFTGR